MMRYVPVLLFLLMGGYMLMRSYGMLLELLPAPPTMPKKESRSMIRSIAFAMGLLLWFSVGVMALVFGLTSLFEKIIYAIQ